MKRLCMFVTLSLIFLGVNLAFADSFSSLNRKGNKAYKQGLELLKEGDKSKAAEAWDEASKFYRDAEIDKPE
jgi:hypothetical protein